MKEIGPILLVMAFAGLAVLLMIWHFSRSETILRRWAEQNGYRLIDRQFRWFLKGPFFWTSSRNQTVYRVTVEDAAGDQRRGWVRCGGWFLGLFSDQVDVRWDD